MWCLSPVGTNLRFKIRADFIAHTAEMAVRITPRSIAGKAETGPFAVKLILAIVVIFPRNTIAFSDDMCPDLFGNSCRILIDLSGNVNNPLLLIEHGLNRCSVDQCQVLILFQLGTSLKPRRIGKRISLLSIEYAAPDTDGCCYAGLRPDPRFFALLLRGSSTGIIFGQRFLVD